MSCCNTSQIPDLTSHLHFNPPADFFHTWNKMQNPCHCQGGREDPRHWSPLQHFPVTRQDVPTLGSEPSSVPLPGTHFLNVTAHAPSSVRYAHGRPSLLWCLILGPYCSPTLCQSTADCLYSTPRCKQHERYPLE